MLHSLAHQGINRETYLRIAGRDEDEIVEQSKPDAEQALRREAVLAAIIEAEAIEPSDDEVFEAVEQAAGEGGGRVSPKKLLERLKSQRAGSTRSSRTSPSARRWTSSPSRRSRSRSSRRRRARSSGRRVTPKRAKSGSTRPDLDAGGSRPSRKTG